MAHSSVDLAPYLDKQKGDKTKTVSDNHMWEGLGGQDLEVRKFLRRIMLFMHLVFITVFMSRMWGFSEAYNTA